jgi:hypothetical protein
MMIGFDQINDDGTMQDNITVEDSISGITVKSTDPYRAFGHISFPLRKKTSTPEKITQYVIDYFKKLKMTIQNNIDKMTNEHAKLAKSKI